jgi:MoxR-like ATPase
MNTDIEQTQTYPTNQPGEVLTSATLPSITAENATIDVRESHELAAAFSKTFKEIEGQVRQAVVGMDMPVRLVLASVFTGGHVLLEGPPGVAKTTLANAVSTALGLDTSRIQCTPDLLPADITGSQFLSADHQLRFRQGPVFTQVLLADEINRTPPKTQAALLQAMAERTVSNDRDTFDLPFPFMVIATQNPIESQGVYPLPEASLDRFAVKVQVSQPSLAERMEIGRRTTGVNSAAVSPVFSAEEAAERIEEMQALVRAVSVTPELEENIARICCSLHPGHPDAVRVESVGKNILQGPSPRADQALLLLSKTFALLEGRMFVMQEDIAAAAVPTLCHRLIVSMDAMWDRSSVSTSAIVREVCEGVFNSKRN